MEHLLNLALTFPVLPFSLLMGMVFLYWLAVILGQVGLDALDGDGAAEALSGKAEALGAIGDGLDGAGEAIAGKAEALAGKAEALAGKSEALGAEGHGLLDVLGLGGVPVTIALSLLIFIGWASTLLGMHWLGPALPDVFPSPILKGGVFVGGGALGVGLSALAIKPLRPFFKFKHAPTRNTLLGRVCVIDSGSVDGRHGQAILEDGGAGLRLHVVCARANTLKRGDRALILEFDPAREVYEVEPVDWLLPEELSALDDPSRAAALARAKERAS